jgi:hypothetical protein
VVSWSQFALDEYSLSVVNVAWILCEHDEVTGCSLYSVRCKHNAVGLFDRQRYFCIQALVQQVISLQFGDIAGFIFCWM